MLLRSWSPKLRSQVMPALRRHLGEGRQHRGGCCGRRGLRPRGARREDEGGENEGAAHGWPPRSIHSTKVRTSSAVSGFRAGRHRLRGGGPGLRVPRPRRRPAEQVPDERAAPCLARRCPGKERASPVEPGPLAPGPVAGQALRLDERPHVGGVAHRATLLRGQVEHRGRRLQGLREAVGRGPLGVLVAAHAALGRVVAHPDPRGAAQRQAVRVDELQLDRACWPAPAPGTSRPRRAGSRRGDAGRPPSPRWPARPRRRAAASPPPSGASPPGRGGSRPPRRACPPGRRRGRRSSARRAPGGGPRASPGRRATRGRRTPSRGRPSRGPAGRRRRTPTRRPAATTRARDRRAAPRASGRGRPPSSVIER